MATVIMNMGDYAIKRNAEMGDAYGEEVMSSGWNPVLDLAVQERLPAPTTRQHGPMPADLAAMDVEQFVRRMYVYLSYE